MNHLFKVVLGTVLLCNLGCGAATQPDNDSSHSNGKTDDAALDAKYFLVTSDSCEEIRPDPACECPDTKSTTFPWWLEVSIKEGDHPAVSIRGYESLATCDHQESSFCFSSKDTWNDLSVTGSIQSGSITVRWQNMTIFDTSNSEKWVETRCTLTGSYGGLGVDEKGYLVSPAIRECWSNRSGTFSELGQPTSAAFPWKEGLIQKYGPGKGDAKYTSETVCAQSNSSQTAHFLDASIWPVYFSVGGPTSFLGYPTSDWEKAQIPGPSAPIDVWVQRFEGGVIFVPPGENSLQVAKALPDRQTFRPGQVSQDPAQDDPQIRNCYMQNGGSVLGEPTDLVKSLYVHWGNGFSFMGRYQPFSVGPVCLTGSKGAYLVKDMMLGFVWNYSPPLGMLSGSTQYTQAKSLDVITNSYNGDYQSFYGSFYIQDFTAGQVYCWAKDPYPSNCYLLKPNKPKAVALLRYGNWVGGI